MAMRPQQTQAPSKQGQGWSYRNSHPFNESNSGYIEVSYFCIERKSNGTMQRLKKRRVVKRKWGQIVVPLRGTSPTSNPGRLWSTVERACVDDTDVVKRMDGGNEKSSKNKPPSVVAQWTSLRNPSFLKREWVRERKEGKIGKVQQRRQQQQKEWKGKEKRENEKRRERVRVRERGKGRGREKKVVVRMDGWERPAPDRKTARDREREREREQSWKRVWLFWESGSTNFTLFACIQYTCIRRLVGFIGWCLTVHAHFRLFTGMQLCTAVITRRSSHVSWLGETGAGLWFDWVARGLPLHYL